MTPETGPKPPIRLAAQGCPDSSAIFCEEVADVPVVSTSPVWTGQFVK